MRCRLLAMTLGAFASIATLYGGPILFETTTLPIPGQPGDVTLASWQFLGNIFVLTSPSHINGIGTYAEASDGGTIFGAILSLPNVHSLPSGNPFDNTTLASTTLSPGLTTDLVSAPLSVDLPAGAYAVVFGTGYYGATASFAALGRSNGTASPSLMIGDNQIAWGFFCGGNCWKSYGSPSPYFFQVAGTSSGASNVPEPSAMVLACAGLAGLIVLRRAKARTA